MEGSKKKERNHNIDFLRGIATLWIILIHTAWWSGEIYLPPWFSNLTLIIDVPVFMFIAGISFNYSNSVKKNLTGIVKQWLKWLYFLIFYILLFLIFFKEQFYPKDILYWIIYQFPRNNSIQVVAGSIWFINMYIKVTIPASIIICLINHFFKEKRLKYFKLLLLFSLCILIYITTRRNILFIDSYFAFYFFIYLLGYTLNNYKLKRSYLIFMELCLFIVNIVVFKYYHLDITSIQTIKFPPTLIYLLFSLISIAFFWYLKDSLKIKKGNILNYVGKNAIVFYFSQGVSSSFLYYALRFISFNNPIFIFIIMLILNLTITSIMAILLNISFNYLKKLLNFLKTKLKK